VPPKPTVTLPLSTMTGTLRDPLVCFSITASAASSFLTLKYSTSPCRRW
jgi:hypothetical protein